MIYYDFFSLTILVHIKLSHYWFNRRELLQKAKDRYHNGGGKEEAAEYYLKTREVLKGNENNKYRRLSQIEKKVKKNPAEISTKT